MSTWMFFLGLELIIVIICAVWCVKWMNVTELDEDDRLLEAMSKKHQKSIREELERRKAEAKTQAR